MNKQRRVMRILLAGGGSGGHVTPLKALVEVFGNTDVKPEVRVITDRLFYSQTKQVFSDLPSTPVTKIFAGKFRRYHGKTVLWHLLHPPTVVRNIRDGLYVAIGTLQAVGILFKYRPNVVFCKGGFVCLPVGWAARLLRIPLILHDSDTVAGLTNRVLASHATVIATGMPAQYYHYPLEKMRYIGIPVDPDLKPITQTEQARYKSQLGFDPGRPLLLVTGGGLGAQRLNQAVIASAPALLSGGWSIAHITGKDKSEAAVQALQQLSEQQGRDHWRIEEFVNLTSYILAADVIVSRTGASAMQEYANAKKTVITIPGKHLSGGHQVTNSKMFTAAGATLVLDEDKLADDPGSLAQTVMSVWGDTTARETMSQALFETFAKPSAANDLSKLIIESALSRH